MFTRCCHSSSTATQPRRRVHQSCSWESCKVARHCNGFALLCTTARSKGARAKQVRSYNKSNKCAICIAAGPHLWAEGSCLEVICERDTWQQPWLAAEEAEARKQLQEVRQCADETAAAVGQMNAVCGCVAIGGLCVASAFLRTTCCMKHPAAARSIQVLLDPSCWNLACNMCLMRLKVDRVRRGLPGKFRQLHHHKNCCQVKVCLQSASLRHKPLACAEPGCRKRLGACAVCLGQPGCLGRL